MVWADELLGREKNHDLPFPPEGLWLNGAGGLLLLAAAHETGLLAALETALSACRMQSTHDRSRLPQLRRPSSQSLLLTLLFLGVVGVHRPWELRGYTADMLALLTGRQRAYGYTHTERFLSQVVQANGAEYLTQVLATWTASLWHPTEQSSSGEPSIFYIDGHRKPVYTDQVIPRGLVGRLGMILGCRALVLLHDEQGHPLLAMTSRGDQHLTRGLPSILIGYEQASRAGAVQQIVVDREAIAAEFLASLNGQGRIVISVLRSDQYDGLESFTEVGAFVPLQTDQQGTVLREVAPASIALPLPDHPGETLPLHVALIRDLRRSVPLTQAKDGQSEQARWMADADRTDLCWWKEGWQATPAPAVLTMPKLIPIVTTASTVNAVQLAQTYIHRWSAQENIIKDFLLPLGLDCNHGYAKIPVEHSEIAKKRAALEKRLATLQQRAAAARKRAHQAGMLYTKRCQRTKARADTLYRMLNRRLMYVQREGMEPGKQRAMIKELQTAADAEIEQYRARQWKAYQTSNQEFEKCKRYCRDQRAILRALEDLKANESVMYELDNQKDQVMTVFKVALTNLVMWTRDHSFPASFAQATWKRLAPFFQLAGQVRQGPDTVLVELRPFNDRQYNRDLAVLCERVNSASLHLPDGRRLLLTVNTVSHPILDVQKRQVA